MSGLSALMLAGSAFAWFMLPRAWKAWLAPRLDARVRAANECGEQPPRIRGLSNYEQAEIADALHREAHMTVRERAFGFAITCGVPLAVVLVAFFTRP